MNNGLDKKNENLMKKNKNVIMVNKNGEKEYKSMKKIDNLKSQTLLQSRPKSVKKIPTKPSPGVSFGNSLYHIPLT